MKAGTFIYLYIFNSFHCENASCEHAMLKNGASGEISRYKCWLVVSSDEMSPYTSGSRTFSVTDRRLITDLSTAPYDQKRFLRLLSNVHFDVESLTTKLLDRSNGRVRRQSLHDITGLFASCYKSHKLPTRLRLLRGFITRLQCVV